MDGTDLVILVPITLFVLIGVAIVAIEYFRYRRRQNLQITARTAIDKGQDLCADVLETIATPKMPPGQNLRRGIVVIALFTAADAPVEDAARFVAGVMQRIRRRARIRRLILGGSVPIATMVATFIVRELDAILSGVGAAALNGFVAALDHLALFTATVLQSADHSATFLAIAVFGIAVVTLFRWLEN